MPEHLPPIWVDPILIEQVLINLMKNGIEAMAQAPERVLVVRVRGGAGHLVIDVIDRGTGIDASAQARLFEPFYSTKVEGMGMGLNICRSIVEFHQGRLWVDNNADGRGCTFHMLLPLNRGASAEDTAPAETATTDQDKRN